MNVPATLAALGGEKVRRRLPELATEALMVVFAVLVALGVEEWREERQLRAFADRARAAVDLEIEQNLDEFRSDGPDLIDGRDHVGSTLRKLREAQETLDPDEEGGVDFSFSFDFPDISTAAWRVAQSQSGGALLRLRLGDRACQTVRRVRDVPGHSRPGSRCDERVVHGREGVHGRQGPGSGGGRISAPLRSAGDPRPTSRSPAGGHGGLPRRDRGGYRTGTGVRAVDGVDSWRVGWAAGGAQATLSGPGYASSTRAWGPATEASPESRVSSGASSLSASAR